MPADLIPLHSRADAVRYGDQWQEYARKLQAHNDRLQMLLFCAETHARASELLREYAEAQLDRINAVLRESSELRPDATR